MISIAIVLILIYSMSVQSELLITPFIHDAITSISICNGEENSRLFEEVLNVSQRKNIWVNQWNCFEDPIPKTSDGLIILVDIEPQDFEVILGRENIQGSLTSNHWIVYSNQKTLEVTEYFNQRKLRISPSARIFVVKPSFNPGHDAIQVQGTGSYEVFLKVNTLYPRCNMFVDCYFLQYT